MDIPRLPATVTCGEVAAALAAAGCAVVESLVAPAVVDRARDELAAHVEATAYGADGFAGRRTKRTGGLIARSPTCRELVVHPTVLGTVGEVLAHASSHQLHLTQLISIEPGETAQRIHRDQWAFDFFPFPQGYEVQCNTIWAMTDFTEENGATRLVPGSHRLADRLEIAPGDTVPAEMRTGSVLFYTGALYHGAGANRATTVRQGINLTYAVSWLRQEENQYLAVPFEQARSLPEPLLRLMGYARGAYALGYVDDLRDPLDVLLGRLSPASTGLGDLAATTDRLRDGGRHG